MLPWVYVDAVRHSGGRPVLLPPGGDDDEARDTVAGLDGLVVSGGPDIDPSRYGAARHPETQVPVTLRDAWEFAVTGHALTFSYEVREGHAPPPPQPLSEDELIERLKDEFDAEELRDSEEDEA